MPGSPSNVVPLDQPNVVPLDQPAEPWPVQIVDHLLSDDQLGLQTLQTWVASRQWVHRRVETITFVDERRVRRHVSIDLTVPEHAPRIEPRPGRAARLLPLAIMRKRTLVNFDLRDREGAALLLLSLRQNQRLTFTLLQAWARTVLADQRLEPPLREALEHFVCGTREETREAWKRMERWKTSADVEDEQGRRLMSDSRFEAVVKRLKNCFLLFVAVEAEPFTELLVRYSYERSIALYSKRPRRGPRQLVGAQPMTLEFPQPSAEFAQSYHWEIESPKGVDIVSAELLGRKWVRRREFLDDLAQEHLVDERTRLDGLEEELSLRRINLHAVDMPPGSRTCGHVELWPERGGWLQLSTAVAWLSGLALVLAGLRLPQVMAAGPGSERRPDAIVLLFITYALILEALLIKPDEHPLAARLLAPFRWAAAVCGLLPLTASFLLVFWPEARWQPAVWLALGVVGLALAATQTLALWIMAPGDDLGSPWTADAVERRPPAGQGGRRRRLRRVRLRVRSALVGRRASLSQEGQANADEDFYGGDVWNQEVHEGVEQALRSRLNTVS